jgi:hypothetical protein
MIPAPRQFQALRVTLAAYRIYEPMLVIDSP